MSATPSAEQHSAGASSDAAVSGDGDCTGSDCEVLPSRSRPAGLPLPLIRGNAIKSSVAVVSDPADSFDTETETETETESDDY